MRFNVNFIKDAEEDLLDIYEYVYLNDSEDNAEKLFNNLYRKCLTLQAFPKRGRILPELKLLEIENFLEIFYKPYRIVYQIIQDEVFIHCILDGRREIQKLLQERLLRI
jgi:toxin ParE1/3/4